MATLLSIRRSPWVIGSVIAAWGLGTVASFWRLEAQYLRPASRPRGAAIAQPDRRPPPPVTALTTNRGIVALGAPGTITLLNFWNAHCPCSRYMEAHVAGLQKRYAASGVRVITVVEGDAGVDTAEDLLAAWRARGGGEATADPDGRVARAFGVWAAPGAAIIDRSGRVSFVGGYNAARFCDNTQTAWAAQALDAAVRGAKPPRAKTLFFGCQVLAQPR
ncbi:hypothetical protein CCAX7_42410 [Capsulimonas corticalis]|uniref:Uncharacterized protein n=1 Tax=Capsulimonas corticalis TaxID=2219043 RepID=A0A402CXS8_9BACT|nr:TlpA disulfide reductase family protein [Capsulimonas corticalis]BDI32190.1 hypothetical protein CCAX7_42410 [Capsulimonas corticalis]